MGEIRSSCGHFELPRMTKQEQEDIKLRFKDPNDPLKFVIVRDMRLTGFDAPYLHTMYVNKPMRDHNLMQAIARVNRVFKDKPGGLIVDYAIAVMQEKYDIIRSFFHGFHGIDYTNWRGR